MARTFDCESLFTDDTVSYEHEYERYLDFFKLLAYSETAVRCENVPPSWWPFIWYMGHHPSAACGGLAYAHDADAGCIDWSSAVVRVTNEGRDARHIVEMASSAHPELVHALYLYDTAWPRRTRHPHFPAFPVTCNGSFFRPEITAYLELLDGYAPTKRRAVVVPCAAHKPYPSPMHDAVRRAIPEHWDIIVATGVLGLVPCDLWPEMPEYDSGVPNLFRCEEVVRWYFSRNEYERVVVYSDFYAYAIARGMPRGTRARFVFGDHYRDSYDNLLLP